MFFVSLSKVKNVVDFVADNAVAEKLKKVKFLSIEMWFFFVEYKLFCYSRMAAN